MKLFRNCDFFVQNRFLGFENWVHYLFLIITYHTFENESKMLECTAGECGKSFGENKNTIFSSYCPSPPYLQSVVITWFGRLGRKLARLLSLIQYPDQTPLPPSRPHHHPPTAHPDTYYVCPLLKSVREGYKNLNAWLTISGSDKHYFDIGRPKPLGWVLRMKSWTHLFVNPPLSSDKVRISWHSKNVHKRDKVYVAPQFITKILPFGGPGTLDCNRVAVETRNWK